MQAQSDELSLKRREWGRDRDLNSGVRISARGLTALEGCSPPHGRSVIPASGVELATHILEYRTHVELDKRDDWFLFLLELKRNQSPTGRYASACSNYINLDRNKKKRFLLIAFYNQWTLGSISKIVHMTCTHFFSS